MGDIVDGMFESGMMDMPDPFDHCDEVDDVIDYMMSQGWNGRVPKQRPPLRCKRCGSLNVGWSAYRGGAYKLLDAATGDEHVCQSTPEGFDDVV